MIYDTKKHLKKFLAVLLGAVVIVNTGIVNTQPVFAKNGDIIMNECGDGWVGEGDACTPEGPKDSEEYKNFKDNIKNTIGYLPATAIVKASGNIDFSAYNVKNVVKGPDGYYLLEFNTMIGINDKMKQLSAQAGVEYAGQNYGSVDNTLLEGDNFEESFKKVVDDLIATKNASEAGKPSDEVLKELEESEGTKVKFQDFEKFYEKTNGKEYDLDGAYGAQCVDGARYYIGWLGYDNPARGDARDYWINKYTNGILENFLEIEPGEPLQNGDILVYGAFPGNSHGHISMYHNGLSYGQNQGVPDGSGGPFNEILSYTATPNFLGALRPKCYRNGSEKYKVKVNLEKNVEDAKKS